MRFSLHYVSCHALESREPLPITRTTRGLFQRSLTPSAPGRQAAISAARAYRRRRHATPPPFSSAGGMSDDYQYEPHYFSLSDAFRLY